jgi:predicted RNA-binding protein
MNEKRNYWLITTTKPNFDIDREIGFTVQGMKERYRNTIKKFKTGDMVVYYIKGIQKLGAIAKVVLGYYHDETKIWTDEDEMWPCRSKSKPVLILEDDELLDVKKIKDDLSIVQKYPKNRWGLAFQGAIRKITEEDYNLIESEMRKILTEEKREREIAPPPILLKTEKDYIDAIMKLPLESKSLHDRLAEMMATVGTWMGYNSNTRYRITPEHALELDVAWLRGKNPEVAIEVQVSGNITEAKERLSQAKKFNYRKVILVIKEDQLDRVNSIIRFDEMRHWLDAWSIKSVYNLYTSGETFFGLFRQLERSRYIERTKLELI